MTLSDLHKLLSAVPGFGPKRVAYRAFPEGEAPELPYCTYIEQSYDVLYADNVAFYATGIVDIELYTNSREENTEGLLEAALREASLGWTKEIEYLDSEACFMIVYTVGI